MAVYKNQKRRRMTFDLVLRTPSTFTRSATVALHTSQLIHQEQQLRCIGNVVTEPSPPLPVWRIQRLSPHEVYRPNALIVVVLTLNNGFQELLPRMMLSASPQGRCPSHLPASLLANLRSVSMPIHDSREAGTILIGQQT
jgi:hypothetical protein